MNLKYFQIQKWMLQSGRVEKKDEKDRVICIVFMFLSWVMILKLFKKVHFLILCCPQQTNLNTLKQFTYMHLKRLVTCFHKMLLFTIPWLNVLKKLVFEIEELCYISAESASFLIFWLLINQTLINHIIFLKSVTKTFRSIYVNWFNRLWFLAEVSTKLQKMHFFGQFKDHNSGSMETRKKTPFFHLLFLLYHFKINSPFFALLSFLKIISTLRSGLAKW